MTRHVEAQDLLLFRQQFLLVPRLKVGQIRIRHQRRLLLHALATKQGELSPDLVLLRALCHLERAIQDGHLLGAVPLEVIHRTGTDQRFERAPVDGSQVDTLAEVEQ